MCSLRWAAVEIGEPLKLDAVIIRNAANCRGGHAIERRRIG